MKDFVLVGKKSKALYFIANELKPKKVIIETTPYKNKFLIKKVFSISPFSAVANYILGYLFNNNTALPDKIEYSPEIVITDRVKYSQVKNERVCCFGSSIIRKRTIRESKEIVNLHLGWLPDYKGCKAEIWSRAQNGKVGATLHKVVPEIDAGSILLRSELENYEGPIKAKIELLTIGTHSLIKAWIENNHIEPITNEGGKYYSTPPFNIIMKALFRK